MLQDLVLNKQSEIIYGMPHDYAVQYKYYVNIYYCASISVQVQVGLIDYDTHISLMVMLICMYMYTFAAG